ncbi:hypothetical protein GCM10009104_20800 [Marinobacterium maritimum]|uniref:Uncharacterized protein n=1 Tax=Marinobacterium maritimum TaxID=500162 RepID=A0ABP3T9R3_9GAMM
MARIAEKSTVSAARIEPKHWKRRKGEKEKRRNGEMENREQRTENREQRTENREQRTVEGVALINYIRWPPPY